MAKKTEIIKNAKAAFVAVDKPQLTYDKSSTEWSLTIAVDDETSRNWVKSGYAMKEKTTTIDGVEYPAIKLTRPTTAGQGENEFELAPPVVFDQFGNHIAPGSIGRGSVLDVSVELREWTFQGRSGTTPRLQNIKVVELVEFKGNKPAAGSEFEFVTQDSVSEDEIPF